MPRIIAQRAHLRPAFTLIELLVIIAIIAILASILFPVFARARENARRAACLSNMKQLGLGMMQYMQDYDDVYPMHAPSGTVYWQQTIDPYVKSLGIYNCPSRSEPAYDGTTKSAGHTGYGMNSWLNSYYYPSTSQKGIAMASIAKPAETVWVAEINGVPGPTTTTPYVNELQCFPSYYGATRRTDPEMGFDTSPEPRGRLATRHFDGVNVVWADGHAKWMKRTVLEADTGDTSSISNAQYTSKYWWGRER